MNTRTLAGTALLCGVTLSTLVPATAQATTPAPQTPADGSCWQLTNSQLGSYTFNPAAAKQVDCNAKHNYQVLTAMTMPGKLANKPTSSQVVRHWTAAQCATKIMAATGNKASHLNLNNTYYLKGDDDIALCGVSATNTKGALTSVRGSITDKTLTNSCYLKAGGFRVPCKAGRYKIIDVATLYGPSWYGKKFPGKDTVSARAKNIAADLGINYERAFGPFDPANWKTTDMHVYYTRKL